MSTPVADAANVAIGRPSVDDVWNVLHGVADPEIPVISIVDLGIVRGVRVSPASGECQSPLAPTVTVTLTPTYSGCPATAVIEADVRRALEAAGITSAIVETSLSPPWTTDWLSATGRERLAAYGIAPPGHARNDGVATIDTRGLRRRPPADDVTCPRCRSTATELVSRFGSTPCQSQHRCRTCLEPFNYFKRH